MPIKKDTRAANGISVSYHRLTKFDVDLVNDLAKVIVNSHTDEQAAIDKLPVAWQWTINVSLGDLTHEGALIDELEKILISDGATFEGGELTSDVTSTLETIKARKRAEITAARLKADSGYFIYEYTVTTTEGEGEDAVTKETLISKNIKTSDKDMFDLLVAQSMILMGEMPPDWPGGWKAIDNTYVPISTPEEWKPFFMAMYKTGITNYRHSQQLKAQIEAATTADEVLAIRW